MVGLQVITNLLRNMAIDRLGGSSMHSPPYSSLAQRRTLWQGAVGLYRRDIQPRHSCLHLPLPGVTAPRFHLQLPRNHPRTLPISPVTSLLCTPVRSPCDKWGVGSVIDLQTGATSDNGGYCSPVTHSKLSIKCPTVAQ